MSKNRLRNNTESIRIENRSCAPSAQPVASPLAQAARLPCLRVRPLACRALSRARAPSALPRAGACRLGAQRPACACLRAPCTPSACCAQLPPVRPVRALHAQMRAQHLPSAHVPCHNTSNCIAIQFSLLQPFFHNTLDCIEIQSKPTQQPLLQYTPVYCNPNSTLQACFFAIQYNVLQYNFYYSFFFPALSLAIQLQGLQYKKYIFFFSQYNLGSSPKTVMHIKKNFFHYFQQQKKSLKIIKIIFFHSNKFLKIYFLHFSSISHLVKS